MAKRVYHVFDGDEGSVPDLLPKSPLRRPLTRTVKNLAMLAGALTTITGSVMGAGRWALKTADIATNAIVGSQLAAMEKRRQDDSAVDARNRAADKAEILALIKELRDALPKPRKGARGQ